MQEPAPYTMRLTFPTEQEATSVIVESVGREEERRSLQDCWWVITNRLRLITVFFCGTVLATVLFLMLMPRTYTAEVTLLIERKPPRVLDIHETSTEPLVPDEYDFYQTQYELLKSRALAAQVIRELELSPQNLKRSEGKGMLEGVKLYSR
jgi:polysaccharide biosynthesis transport protein